MTRRERLATWILVGGPILVFSLWALVDNPRLYLVTMLNKKILLLLMPAFQPLKPSQSQAQHLQLLWLMPPLLPEIRTQKIKKQRVNLSYSTVLNNPPCAGFFID